MMFAILLILVYCSIIGIFIYVDFILDKKLYKRIRENNKELEKIATVNTVRIEKINEKIEEMTNKIKKYADNEIKEDERLAISLYN